MGPEVADLATQAVSIGGVASLAGVKTGST